MPWGHPLAGGHPRLPPALELFHDLVAVELRQRGKEHQQEFALGVVLVDPAVVFRHGDEVDVLPVAVDGAVLAVLRGDDVVLDELQRAQQRAAQTVDARHHQGVDADVRLPGVEVRDRAHDLLQGGALHVRAGIAVVDEEHQVFVAVGRAPADDIGLLDIQPEAQIRLPVGGYAEIAHVDEKVVVLVQLHGLVDDDLHVVFEIQYVFQVIGSLCLFHKYTFLGL